MGDTYVLEQMLKLSSEVFQLKFARDASQYLVNIEGLGFEESHRGLLLLGTSEEALDGAVALLRARYGADLRVDQARVRYVAGSPPLEPVMDVIVRAPAEFADRIRCDLIVRGGTVFATALRHLSWTVHAQAPLVRLLRYREHLSALTRGHARHFMALNRFDRIDPVPGGDAA